MAINKPIAWLRCTCSSHICLLRWCATSDTTAVMLPLVYFVTRRKKDNAWYPYLAAPWAKNKKPLFLLGADRLLSTDQPHHRGLRRASAEHRLPPCMICRGPIHVVPFWRHLRTVNTLTGSKPPLRVVCYYKDPVYEIRGQWVRGARAPCNRMDCMCA